MSQSLLEMTKELVRAQILAGGVSAETVAPLLRATFQNLQGLRAMEDANGPMVEASVAPPPPSLPDWKTSITRRYITCLECGAQYKQLPTSHLTTHNLDPATYRAKYGMPATQSLAARDVVARKRELAQQNRPWEKAAEARVAQAPAPPAQTKRTTPKVATSKSKARPARKRSSAKVGS
jgi:predicted transcriptional regulator